jgi:hypothetical protein
MDLVNCDVVACIHSELSFEKFVGVGLLVCSFIDCVVCI